MKEGDRHLYMSKQSGALLSLVFRIFPRCTNSLREVTYYAKMILFCMNIVQMTFAFTDYGVVILEDLETVQNKNAWDQVAFVMYLKSAFNRTPTKEELIGTTKD